MLVDIRVGDLAVTEIQYSDGLKVVETANGKGLAVKNAAGKIDQVCQKGDAANLIRALQLAMKVWE